MGIDRKTITTGDQVWLCFAGTDHGGGYASVRGGTVVAAGSNGSFVIERVDGGVLCVHSWGIETAHATEADAWHAAADRLQQAAHALIAKSDECRAKARGEVAS